MLCCCCCCCSQCQEEVVGPGENREKAVNSCLCDYRGKRCPRYEIQVGSLEKGSSDPSEEGSRLGPVCWGGKIDFSAESML